MKKLNKKVLSLVLFTILLMFNAAYALEAQQSPQKVIINGQNVDLNAVNVNGYNYFQLRQLLQALGIEVGYDNASETIVINTDNATQTTQTTQTTQQEQPKTNSNIDTYYEVVEVVDGDTIKALINNETVKIRLLLVDTPESKHPDKNRNVPLGATATDFTKDFLKNEKIKLEYDEEKTDKYGRTLAYVYRESDGKCLNEALILASLAKVVKYEPNVKYYKEYKELERQVRPSAQGIWADIQAAYPKSSKNQSEEDTNNAKQETQTQDIQVIPPDSTKPIKGNINTMIYHCPGQRDYNKLKAENIEWFATEEDAKNAGYRKAKR